MHTIVLCGGFGTRLRPYTAFIPKPMLPIGSRPLLELILKKISIEGGQSVTLAVGPYRKFLNSYFGTGEELGLRLNYVDEKEPLGTAGILSTLTDLPDHFVIVNGDVLSRLSYAEVLESHIKSGADLTVCTAKRAIEVPLGMLDLDPQLQVTRYREKPLLSVSVSMGIYAMSRAGLESIAWQGRMDMPDVANRLIENGRSVRAHLYEGPWVDIGSKADLERAQEEFSVSWR